MALKNPMEEKQLNLHQPLLSVRRGSSKKASSELNKRNTNNCSPNFLLLPYYRSESKSGPLRNPGAVPFQWEHTPGKPKDESKEQREIPEQLPRAPKLPPGRVVNLNKQQSTQKVPKESSGSSSRSQSASPEFSSVDKVLSELVAEEMEKEKESDNISSSEDENVTYVDAQDTLSWTESFLNCSFSGVSGLDGSNMGPLGPFSDPEVRGFMMGRFLPAAKAVASETPQYASKKHHVAREKPKPVKPVKKVLESNGSPIYYDVHNISLHNIHGEGEDEEEEVEEDEYEGPEDLSAKLCGLLPKFCLLNPLPGLRDHAQIIPQVRGARTKLAYSGARINENMNRTGNQRGEVKRMNTNKSLLNGDFGRKCTEPSKDGSPQSFLGAYRGFVGLPEVSTDFRARKADIQKKGYTRFKELLAEHVTEGITSPVNPIIERTLYVDSEQRVESRNSNSSSSGSRGRTPSVDYSLQDAMQSHCGVDEKVVSQPNKRSLEKSSKNTEEDLVKDLQKDRDLSLVVVDVQKESRENSSSPLVLAPLLLKSPSESWLSRTLPSISSKNPTSKANFGNPGFKPMPSDPKRGRMLRTSNGHLLVFHPPAELAPILEN